MPDNSWPHRQHEKDDRDQLVAPVSQYPGFRRQTGYSIEQCQADYRSGFLYPFYFKVMVLAFMDLNDEEGRIMAHMQIERISAAIRDHNLVGLLRAI